MALAFGWMPTFAPVADETVVKQCKKQGVSPVPCNGVPGTVDNFALPVPVACTASETSFVATAAKPGRPGYCKCGCGARCQSSADCGGSACVAYITCCWENRLWMDAPEKEGCDPQLQIVCAEAKPAIPGSLVPTLAME